MLYLDEKFIKLSNLDQLEKKDNAFNFRCPFCGDSKQSKFKKRGYFILNKQRNGYYFYCHNCTKSLPLKKFLKNHRPYLYKDYIKESFFNHKDDRNEGEKIKKQILKNNDNDILKSLNSIENDYEKNIIQFLKKRCIPKSVYKNLYWTANFKKFVNDNIKKKFKHDDKSDLRIVIPCYKNGKLIALQGRKVLGIDDKFKYFTVSITDDFKLHNIDNIDNTKPVYVFEGFFDSCFFKNAVSMFGANFKANQINELINDPIYIFDNDFRKNKEILKKMVSMTENPDNKIVIFPEEFKYKDVNQAIECSMEVSEINMIIKNHIYQDFEARVLLGLVK